MNRKQNCINCGSKHSLLAVKTIEYVKKREKYPTHSNKTAFRLCKKCGNHSDFRLNEIIGKFFLACFIPEFERQLENLKGKKNQSCVICSENAVIRLYLNSSKNPFGYFCYICEKAYYLPIKKIKWQNHNLFKHTRIDLLNPLNQLYRQEVIKVNRKLKAIRKKLQKGEKMPRLKPEEKPHPRFNQDSGLIQWFMNLDSIGPFITTEGAPLGDIEHSHNISIPKNKYQKIMKLLRENNCTIT